MNRLALDHIILVVSDLQIATRQFTQLGFSVIPGGVHSGGSTHNALVPFPDGTYLELLSTTKSSRLSFLFLLKKLHLLGLYIGDDTAINRRLIDDLASGIGMADFCMLSGDLDQEISLLMARGSHFTDPISGGRLRPDGQEIAWRTAVPSSLDLPFLIDDSTPRELRVPSISDDFHKNGILGITGVAILVTNLVESMARYRAFLGDDPVSQTQFPQPGTQSSDFDLNNQFISILSPVRGNSALLKPLKYRPSRPVGIFFKTADNGTRDPLCLTYLPERGATLSRSKVLFP
ncbi:MAG: VOC family protein [Anaerolineales bacterium]